MEAKNSIHFMNQDFVKLDRFDGTNFTRWQDKMKFFLTALQIYYVLDPNLQPLPEADENDTEEIRQQRKKREDDELVCKGHMLNTLSDRLYDLFTSTTSPHEIWNTLEAKYKTEKDGKLYSIWNEEFPGQSTSNEPISRMLSESIYTDIVINARDGSIGAHRAVLAANSPVFKTMFSKSYMEKETSTVNINDLSIGACRAMLNFVYGKRKSNELRAHNEELILAADKYDIMDFKMECEINLCEDVGVKNVFERLICADKYDLTELKRTCLFYLVKMGMIFELREDYYSFIREADPELVVIVSGACLDAWEAS